MIPSIKVLLKQIFHIEFHKHSPSEDEIELIKNTKLFDKLEATQFNELFKKVHLDEFEEESLIVKEGEPADALYIILDGSVRVFINDREGTKVTLVTLNKGAYFGEQALVARTNRTRNANVESISKTTLIKIHENVMSKIFNIDTELKDKLKSNGFKQSFEIFRRIGRKDR